MKTPTPNSTPILANLTVDLQVNGVALPPGRDFADYSVPGLTVEKALASAKRWRKLGAAIVTTVITSPWEVYRQSLPALAAAMALEGGENILGIAIEGPFMNKLAKGAHPGECMRPPSISEFEELQEMARGKIVLVHVAPELPGAIELIRHIVSAGVVVSIAHCDLDRNGFMRAVDAGATLVTHVCNGLPSTVDRAALKEFWKNLVLDLGAIEEFKERGANSARIKTLIEEAKAEWRIVDLIHAYLSTPGIHPMIIPDGAHITDPFIQVAAALNLENLIITSDAAPIAYAPLGSYEGIFGSNKPIEVRMGPGDRPELSTLCGSYWPVYCCVNTFGSTIPLNSDTAFKLCRDNPLSVLREPLSRIGIDLNKRVAGLGDLVKWDGMERMLVLP